MIVNLCTSQEFGVDFPIDKYNKDLLETVKTYLIKALTLTSLKPKFPDLY